MRKIVLLLSVLLLASCTKKSEKPNPYIEKEKMTNILYDFSILSGIENTNAYYTDSVPSIDINSILNKYQIDSLVFAENNRYYINLEDGTYLKMQEEIKRRLEKNKIIVDSLFEKDNKFQHIEEIKLELN